MIATIPQFMWYFFAAVLAIAGFSIASYIRHKKVSQETLVCPIGHTCDTVIHSDYSKFFGIPIELMGMLYYGIIAFSYLAIGLRSDLAWPEVSLVLLLLSTFAFLFSIYLTFIQAFALKQWCTWCIISASLCTLIFASTLFALDTGVFVEMLGDYRRWFIGAHLLGLVFGLGGATISDTLFFRFLKDLKISKTESSVLHMLSQIIWFGLGIGVLSGLGLFLPASDRLMENAKFLAKVTFVGIIILNGAFLNLYSAPKLVHMSFGKWADTATSALRKARKASFAMGAISIVSWYSVFVLGIMRWNPLSYKAYIAIYGMILAGSLIISQLAEQFLGRKKMPQETPEQTL